MNDGVEVGANVPVDLPVLVFDGDCGFCTTSARAAQRWWHLEHVEPWQSIDLDRLGLTSQQCLRAVQWVGIDGQVASAERAVIAAMRRAGGGWAQLARVLNLPGLRHACGLVYRLVAKYRYRLPGGTPACKLP